MEASKIVLNLPETPTPEREEALLELLRQGEYLPIQWCAFQSNYAGHRAVILCASDALQVGTPNDPLRINVTHTGAQKAADILGLRLPTTKIADLIHQDAVVRIAPCTQTPDSRMAHTSRMYQHSRAVGSKIQGRGGLVSTVGKDWVLTNRLYGHPEKGANFGWHVERSNLSSPGGLPVLQSLGLAHNRYHVDYSQVLRLIHPDVTVDGEVLQLDDILQDPELCNLVSYEGPLKIVRHPGVELPTASVPPPVVCGG